MPHNYQSARDGVVHARAPSQRDDNPAQRKTWNPMWGWAVFAIAVLAAMVLAFTFGGSDGRYS